MNYTNTNEQGIKRTPGKAYQKALAALLGERHPDGYWVGELSTSALSTATVVAARSLVQENLHHRQYDSLIQGGVAWLVANQNEDGGWGDTIKSFSNISTTMLCRAAFHIAGAANHGSWPIDTNLSTWLTTLAINAVGAAGELKSLDYRDKVRDWLFRQQYRQRHPYTGAEPGVWAWTDLRRRAGCR